MKYYFNEEALNEHIPRDLYAAYKKANQYNSTQHPNTDHTKISSSTRRNSNYRYGNSTYRVISADEALALVQQDPHNVEYLRGIKDGELVEYEYQNSKYYPLYANSTTPVSYTKANGEVVTKKNIRYITNPKIWIPLLDKIYWTDEYEHEISDDEKETRNAKSDVVAFGQYKPTSDADFNQFRPFNHYLKNIKAVRAKEPDTGAHTGSDVSTYNDNNHSRISYSPTFSEYVRLDDETTDLLNKFFQEREEKITVLNTYNAFRKALQKLERDKDEYDEDEYNERKEQWENTLKSLRSSHELIALRLSRVKTQLTKYFESAGNEFVVKFQSVIARLQEALQNCESLKKRIDTLKALAVDNLKTSDIDAQWRSPEANLISRIDTLRTELTSLIKELKALEDQSENIDSDLDTAVNDENKFAEKAGEIAEKSQALDELRQQLFKTYSTKYRELHKKMADIEDAVNAIKPTRAARKAAKAKAAGKAVLDPEIAGIIQFEEEEEETA